MDEISYGRGSCPTRRGSSLGVQVAVQGEDPQLRAAAGAGGAVVLTARLLVAADHTEGERPVRAHKPVEPLGVGRRGGESSVTVQEH
jgi:hypothetical protein